MRRLPFVLLAPLALEACTDRPATAITAAIATDDSVRQKISHVRLQAIRGEETRHDVTYPLSQFPGSLTFHDESEGSSALPLRVVVEGLSAPLDKGGTSLISRSAKMSFVPEKTKLLRLGLSANCLGVTCKTPGDTCVRGACTSEVFDDPDHELPDFPGDPTTLDPKLFDDLGGGAGGTGGAGGAGTGGAGMGGAGQGGAGMAGAGMAGAGMAGAGMAGAGGCEGVTIPDFTILATGAGPAGGAGGSSDSCNSAIPAAVAATVVLQGLDNPDEYAIKWSLQAGSIQADSEVKGAGVKVAVPLEFCAAKLSATVTSLVCPGLPARTVTLTMDGQDVSPTALPGGYVSAADCDQSTPTLQCGSRLQPWCTIDQAIDAASTFHLKNPSDQRFIEIRVAATQNPDFYAGPIRLPPRVDLLGGCSPRFVDRKAQATTVIRLPDNGTLTLDPLSAGVGGDTATAYSMISSGSDQGGIPLVGHVVISNVTIEMPTSASAEVSDDPAAILAGIHINGSIEANLIQVQVKPGVTLKGTTVGVYVSGTDQGVMGGPRLIDVDLFPSPSLQRNSYGVLLESDLVVSMDICGGRIAGGGASMVHHQSAGVLFQAAGILNVGEATACGAPPNVVTQVPVFTSGLAHHSYGFFLDGKVKASFEGAKLRGVDPATLPATWPAAFAQVSVNGEADPQSTPTMTALYANTTHAAAISLSHSELIGLEIPAATPLTQDQLPLGGAIRGAWISAPGADNPMEGGVADPAFSLSLTAPPTNSALTTVLAGSTGVATAGSMVAPCESEGLFATDGLLMSQGQSEIKVATGRFVGGSVCTDRFGIKAQNYSLTFAVSKDKTPQVVGSENSAHKVECYSAKGLWLSADLTEDVVHQVTGSTFAGGDDCAERGGIYLEGSANFKDLLATGTTQQGGNQVFGLLMNLGTGNQASVTGSTFLGGQAAQGAPSEIMAGLWVQGNGGLLLDQNTIQGAQTGVSPQLGVGLLIERLHEGMAGYAEDDIAPILLTGGSIAGGAGLKSRGVLVRALLQDSNNMPSFVADSKVTLGAEKATETDSKKIPTIAGNTTGAMVADAGDAAGVEATVGGLRLAGIKGQRLVIQGGDAAQVSRGALLCAAPEAAQLCGQLDLEFLDLSAGSAPTVRGVEAGNATGGIEGFTLQSSVISPRGGFATIDSLGLSLPWNNQTTVLSNYIFGAQKLADTGIDIACEMAGGAVEAGGTFSFNQNVCAVEGVMASFRTGMKLKLASIHTMQAQILNNFIHGGSASISDIAWSIDRTALSGQWPTVTGNVVVPAGQGNFVLAINKNLDKMSCQVASGGYNLCASTDALVAIDSQSQTGNNGVMPAGMLPFGDSGLTLAGWNPIDPLCASYSPPGMLPLPGSPQFDGSPRIGTLAMPGPDDCP